MRGINVLALAMLLGSAGPAKAADQAPICADRPGKATGTCTVPADHVQLETGLADWTLLKDGGARVDSLAIGDTTFKYGLTDRSNIEIDVSPWQRTTVRAGGSHESVSGFGDVSVLYKQLLTPSGAPVQVAAMPFVKVPVAKHALGNGKWEGGLLFPVGYSIPKSPLALALTPEVDWVADGDRDGHHLAMAQVVSLGWAVSSELNLSAEIWGNWDWAPAGTVRQASADGSVAYLLSNKVQLDAGANFGLNRSTPGVEVYSGVSVRF